MGIHIPISSKGQIVIPKDVRDALQLTPGTTLTLSCEGRRIMLDVPEPPRKTISYEEFRRRVPKYDGPPIAVEDTTIDFDRIWRQQERDAR